MQSRDEIVRQRQSAIRREIDRQGIALKVVALDSGLPYETLLTYFPQEGGRKPVMLPASAIYALVEGRTIPADLLSLLLPTGFAVVRVPEGIDHDELADCMTDYLAEKQRAHRPESEAGPAIGPGEHDRLTGKALKLVAVAA